MPEFLTLFGMLAAVAVILVLAYYCTRFIAVRGGAGFGTAAAGKHLRVLDQMPVGKDVKLLVAQAGTRYFLLAVSPSGVDMLTELSAEDAEEWLRQDEAKQATPSFREALAQQLKQRKTK